MLVLDTKRLTPKYKPSDSPKINLESIISRDGTAQFTFADETVII